jgi:glucose/arabinose dehydrogenase
VGRIAVIAAAVGVFLVLLGGSGAAACKFALDCKLYRFGIGQEIPADAVPIANGAAVLPSGWREQKVLRGLVAPTDFAFLPSGEILVTQKDGTIVAADPETGRLRKVLDLSSRVSTYDIRGLLTVTVDPDFPTKPFLYLQYNGATDPDSAPTTTHMSRFTWRDGRIDPASEKQLVTWVVDRSHSGGQIAFAPDGTLFMSTGDGQHSQESPKSLPAQDVDALVGKVLHITRDGQGVPGNPFWNGDANATRSKVWAYGFRNPFRLAVQPGTDTPVVGDVGFRAQEEISVVPKGSNNGWPCYEGTDPGPAGYPDTDFCKALYQKDDTNMPLASFPRDDAATIVGGTFTTGESVGSSAPLVYLFGDFVYGWLRYVDVDGDRLSDEPVNFATGVPGPVAVHVGKDAAVYYLSASTGELRRLERQ